VASTKHLIVDGSNTVHAWPELKGLMKRDRGSARSRLIQGLSPIHDVEGVRVTLVFDGRANEISIEYPLGATSFAVVTTPSSQTADDVIEHLVANATEPATCYVATDDRAERETVSSLGAQVLRSTDLATWSERATNRQRVVVQQRTQKNDRTWKAP
jgi:predicted RNA-binding protein with PIN domain